MKKFDDVDGPNPPSSSKEKLTRNMLRERTAILLATSAIALSGCSSEFSPEEDTLSIGIACPEGAESVKVTYEEARHNEARDTIDATMIIKCIDPDQVAWRRERNPRAMFGVGDSATKAYGQQQRSNQIDAIITVNTWQNGESAQFNACGPCGGTLSVRSEKAGTGRGRFSDADRNLEITDYSIRQFLDS